ncbi:macro domain-containing protein [Streptomyces luteogriseus]|uniref:macro domain-containing protein n=1 Tax=Streptomyces luteogriseus TaxID=68233 RepID=UPI00381BB2F2
MICVPPRGLFMSRIGYRLFASFRTRLGRSILAMHFTVAFATLAGGVQFILAVRPSTALQGGWVIAALFLASGLWALLRSIPAHSISRDFTHPSFSITIRVGDLFTESASIVVGFTDVYDTSVSDSDVISPRSVQAQLLGRVYGDDVQSLDTDLRAALRDQPILQTEDEIAKPRGKRERYPIGTVAVLTRENRRIYCVAYSRMSNSLVAKSSVDDLWHSLGNLWSSVAMQGHLDHLAIPILGSDLARVDNLNRESLLRMILLSFVARSREGVVTRDLTVLIHHRNAQDVDMHELQAFLKSL